MPSRRSRIRTNSPTISGGGGGGDTPPDIEWGPDFGFSTFPRASAAVQSFSFEVGPLIGVNPAVQANFVPEIVHDPIPATATALIEAHFTHNVAPLTASTLANFAPEVVHNTTPATAATQANFAPQVVHDPAIVDPTISATVLGPPQWESIALATISNALGSTTLVIDKPSGTVSGDLLLCHIAMDTVTPTMVLPTGWTQIALTQYPAEPRFAFSAWKIAGASEPANYSFGFTVTCSRACGEISRISGAHQTTPIDVSATATGTSTTPTAATVTTTDINRWVCAFIYHSHLLGETHSPPSGHTERSDQNDTLLTGGSSADRIFGTAGATGTAVFSCSLITASQWIAHRVAVTPAERVIA